MYSHARQSTEPDVDLSSAPGRLDIRFRLLLTNIWYRDNFLHEFQFNHYPTARDGRIFLLPKSIIFWSCVTYLPTNIVPRLIFSQESDLGSRFQSTNRECIVTSGGTILCILRIMSRNQVRLYLLKLKTLFVSGCFINETKNPSGSFGVLLQKQACTVRR